MTCSSSTEPNASQPRWFTAALSFSVVVVNEAAAWGGVGGGESLILIWDSPIFKVILHSLKFVQQITDTKVALKIIMTRFQRGTRKYVFGLCPGSGELLALCWRFYRRLAIIKGKCKKD